MWSPLQVDGHVGYFDGSGSSKKLKGEFTLASDTEITPSTKRPHAFSLRGSGLTHKRGVFTMAAHDEAFKEQWIRVFEAHIEFIRRKEALDMDRVDYKFE